MDKRSKSPPNGQESDNDSIDPDETKPLLVADQYDKPAGAESTEKKGISGERLFVVGSVLVTELCERLTYYSVVANLVLFCTSMLKLSSDDASVVTLVFTGTVYIIPVFGGFIADAWAGKYNTIFGSGLIYLLGLFLLPVSAINYIDWFGGDEDLSLGSRKAFFFAGLTLIALGTGGIKANVGPFGAQQVDDLGKDAIQSFFNWFYWFINVGAIIAYSAVAYVQQEKGFDYGLMIPFFSMLIAQVVFFLGRKRYIHSPPEGSVLLPSIGVCVQSCSTCPNPSFDRARKTYGGRYDNEMVDGVRAVVRVLPVFLFVVVYWAVYNQMSTSLFLQSERMDISIGSFKLPAAVLNIFNTIIILVLIPIMDLGVYPLLARLNRSPTLLQRMGIGMVLAACAMLYAGMIEIVRKDDITKHGYINQTLADDVFNASKITMFAQIPEFAFIGSSEVFTSISGLEFAYTQAPQFMQGLIMGLFLMTSGLGSYVASLIIAIVKLWKEDENSDWYPKEPNNGHLEYLFFLLGALTFVNLFAFVFVAKWYKYKQSPEEETCLLDEEVVPVNNSTKGQGNFKDNLSTSV